MGWDYAHGASRADIIREIVSRPTVLDKRVTSGVVWTLERVSDQRFPAGTVTIIGVYLIQSGGRNYPGWGYKGMDETMGPFYFACPVALLDKADPPVNDAARLWREKVREHHAALKTARPATGERYRATREIPLRSGAPVAVGDVVSVSRVTRTCAIVSTPRQGLVRFRLPLARAGLVPCEASHG